MNWKKIEENWKAFTAEHGLKDDSEEKKYFYGRQEIYQAKEHFQGFMIYYRNKFNKSGEFTAFSQKANSFSITIPVKADSHWTLKIKRRNFLNRLFTTSGKLIIDTSLNQLEGLIPLKTIEVLSDDFRDLEISISRFGKLQNDEIPPDTMVIKLTTGHQPEHLNQLNKARSMMRTILKNLNRNEKLKPVPINKV